MVVGFVVQQTHVVEVTKCPTDTLNPSGELLQAPLESDADRKRFADVLERWRASAAELSDPIELPSDVHDGRRCGFDRLVRGFPLRRCRKLDTSVRGVLEIPVLRPLPFRG